MSDTPALRFLRADDGEFDSAPGRAINPHYLADEKTVVSELLALARLPDADREAIRREAREETGLEVKLGELLGVYSDPARDPRGHTVAIVYIATARGEPVAGDDAAGILITDPESAPALAFDHGRILGDYLARRRAAGG